MATFIGIDIETTGASMANNYIIALGACAVDADGKELDRFYAALLPPSAHHTFEQRCMDEFWSKQMDKLHRYQSDGQDPTVVMSTFNIWIRQWKNPVFITDFPEFDIGWINLYLALYADALPLYMINGFRPAINADDIYRGNLNSGGWNTTRRIADKYNYKILDETHHPTEDATAIVTNFVSFLRTSKFQM